MERTKVVVRYANGKVLKGHTQDFFPNKDRFHLFLADNPSPLSVEVVLSNLKAVFLVRDFAGDSQYVEQKRFEGGEIPSGKQLEITFVDGEIMVGSTLGYDGKRSGFFIFPADPRSNNIRVYVISSAVRQVRRLG